MIFARHLEQAIRSIVIIAGCTFVANGCGGATISAGTPNGPAGSAGHQGIELGAHKEERRPPDSSPDNERVVEPQRPLGAAREEQALVHVHGAASTCAGVLVGPRLVVTSRRCTGAGRGARSGDAELRVQIPAGPLAWSTRRIDAWVAPSCERSVADIAVLVLAESVDTKPLTVATVPDTGANVRSMGYGSCGETRAGSRSGVVSTRRDETFRINAALCTSDVGAPVLDVSGNAIGVVVRAGHEEGVAAHDDSEHDPAHTADALRLDGVLARRLMDRARKVEAGDAAAVDAASPCN